VKKATPKPGGGPRVAGRRNTGAHRQAAFRARRAAELTELRAALALRNSAPTPPPIALELLTALSELRRTVQATDDRLKAMQREEIGHQLLRRVAALERLIAGGDIGQAPRGASRRRPLGL
jgi:hypothetical protein